MGGNAGIHIFDISGFFEAGLTLSVVFGVEPFAYTEEFELARERLLDFEVPRPSENLVGVSPASSLVGGKTRTVLTFDGPLAPNGSLADQRYELTIHDERVRDAAGNRLDGDANGGAGGNQVDQFFRLFGDSDGDGDVDGQDFGRFGMTFLKTEGGEGYNQQFDFDSDGDVDGEDYGQLELRFLRSIRR